MAAGTTRGASAAKNRRIDLNWEKFKSHTLSMEIITFWPNFYVSRLRKTV